jgi:spore coat protein CotF
MKKHIKKQKLICKCSSKGQLQVFNEVKQNLKPHIRVFGKLMAISESELATFKHEFEIFYV